MLSLVGIMSCAHGAWISSSRTMGDTLARAVGEGAYSTVHVPVDKTGFFACLSEAKYLIIHTHGSPHGLYDQRADGSRKTIMTLSGIEALPDFPGIQLVILTACQAGGGAPERNVAAALSKKIAKGGLVIANRFVTWGADSDFGEKEGRQGWVGYQNGRLVIPSEKLPARITMADAYRIYTNQHLYK